MFTIYKIFYYLQHMNNCLYNLHIDCLQSFFFNRLKLKFQNNLYDFFIFILYQFKNNQ